MLERLGTGAIVSSKPRTVFLALVLVPLHRSNAVDWCAFSNKKWSEVAKSSAP